MCMENKKLNKQILMDFYVLKCKQITFIELKGTSEVSLERLKDEKDSSILWYQATVQGIIVFFTKICHNVEFQFLKQYQCSNMNIFSLSSSVFLKPKLFCPKCLFLTFQQQEPTTFESSISARAKIQPIFIKDVRCGSLVHSCR